jgi:hypothetical protein
MRERVGMPVAVATDLIAAAPRTAAYATRALLRPLRRNRQHPEIPWAWPSADLVGSVLFEQVLKATMPAMFAPNDEGSLAAVRAEVDRTIELLDAHGWLDDPRGFHREPGPPEDPRVQKAFHYGICYEKLSFTSGYDSPEGSARADERWAAPPNRTAHAYVLRRRGPRPWLIIQHGYGGGQIAEFMMMGALYFHRRLGVNVMGTIAPYHHQRRVLRRGGMGMTSFDYVRNLHSYGQATWDIRRAMSWAEQQGATSISLYGVSMGGYIASLVAGVEPRLRTVIAGIPAIDMAAAIRRRTPTNQWPDLQRNGMFGEVLDTIHRPISPLTFPALVPREQRFVYGAVGDRITTPKDAYLLWNHWERPSVLWFKGTHVTAIMSNQVRAFVTRALAKADRRAAVALEHGPDAPFLPSR